MQFFLGCNTENSDEIVICFSAELCFTIFPLALIKQLFCRKQLVFFLFKFGSFRCLPLLKSWNDMFSACFFQGYY